jgi:hypothetical protein
MAYPGANPNLEAYVYKTYPYTHPDYAVTDGSGQQCLMVIGSSAGIDHTPAGNFRHDQRLRKCAPQFSGTHGNAGGSINHVSSGRAQTGLSADSSVGLTFSSLTAVPGTTAAALMATGSFYSSPTIAAAAAPSSAAAFGIAAPGSMNVGASVL